MPMVTENITESIFRHLFPEDEGNLFAILDGASIDDLLDNLYSLQPEFECLYRGDLEPDMAKVAPYLVKLDAESEFTDWLVRQGWGCHFGIFAVSASDMRAIRGHLRSILTVYDVAGTPLLFRYYDPRVLRLYLPTCNEEELATVFGPVDSYLMEGKTADTMLSFRLKGGVLDQGNIDLRGKLVE